MRYLGHLKSFLPSKETMFVLVAYMAIVKAAHSIGTAYTEDSSERFCVKTNLAIDNWSGDCTDAQILEILFRLIEKLAGGFPKLFDELTSIPPKMWSVSHGLGTLTSGFNFSVYNFTARFFNHTQIDGLVPLDSISQQTLLFLNGSSFCASSRSS